MRASVAVSLVAIAVSVAIAGSSVAQPQPAGDAKQRYRDGMKAFAAQNYEEAANDFEAAGAMRPSAQAYYSSAQAWEKANKPVRAADAYARSIALGGLPGEAEATAKERLGMLQSLLGLVEVTAPPGYHVQLDSDTELPAPATLYGTPGPHTVTVVPPNGAAAGTEQRGVTLELGKTEKLNIASSTAPADTKGAPAPSASAAPPASASALAPEPAPSAAVHSGPSEGFNLRQGLGFTAIGVGAAGLLAGALLGIEAQSARDAYNAGPTRQAYDHASSLATWTDVALIGGGVLAAGGIVLVIWPRSHDGAESAAPAPAPANDAPAPEKEGELRIVPGLGGVSVRGVF